MKYKPNPKNLADSDVDGTNSEVDANEEVEIDDESSVENDLGEEDEQSQSSDEESRNTKKVFKAAKANPVIYEDKETKKQRREEERQKKKMNRSGYIDELRREMMDEPEEVHLGLSRKSKFAKE